MPKAVTKPRKTTIKKAAPAHKKTRVKAAPAAGGQETILLPAVVKKLVGSAPQTDFPESLAPMLATLVDKPFDEDGWLYEIKWDGYRAMAFMNEGTTELKSRNDKSFNEQFYPVYEEIKNWGINAIVDGEIIVTNDVGVSSFGSLQNWRSEADGNLVYYVFDIIWLDGHDLKELPLTERRKILQAVMPANGSIKMSEAFAATATDFFNTAREMELEGMIAKRADSRYLPGARNNDWLKIKIHKRQEVVIGGYTKNENSSKPFSSLLVGVYDKGKLEYTGKIGTGFSVKLQQEMLQQFAPLVTGESPFTTVPDINKPSRFRPNPPQAKAVWLKPELLCEVSYAELTSDGVMRHPSFEGMRADKNPMEVRLETEQDAKTVKQRPAEKIILPKGNKERKTLLNPTDETQVRDIAGHEIKFSNLSKIFWPDEQVSKRDLINYYYQVAPYILPYLKDRPQSLNRYPNGIKGKSFYQKDVTGKVPDWIDTYLYHSNAEDADKHFLVCSDEASLLYMAGMGCIELNPWSSRTKTPDNPDWCIIDLDPDKNSFDQVIEAALVTKQLLDAIQVPSYCKTSGSTGLHIYIPLGAKYTYEQSKEFARAIVTMVHQQLPEYTSIERIIANRNKKMYLDFLQNRPQATIAAPYSLRPKPGATVSMPLHWEEVKKGLKMTDFTIFNAIDRLKNEGDLFKPVTGKGIDLKKVIKNLEAL